MILELKYKTDNQIGMEGPYYIYEYKTMWIPFENIAYAYGESENGEGYIRTTAHTFIKLDKESYAKVVNEFRIRMLANNGGV